MKSIHWISGILSALMCVLYLTIFQGEQLVMYFAIFLFVLPFIINLFITIRNTPQNFVVKRIAQDETKPKHPASLILTPEIGAIASMEKYFVLFLWAIIGLPLLMLGIYGAYTLSAHPEETRFIMTVLVGSILANFIFYKFLSQLSGR